MKKLIIFVLTMFLTFTIFLSGKSANAELTPVTPFYGGDIFNGQELYLFQNYSSTPNFENGYISKTTISEQDVYYQKNSYYNGWYKNLGEDLIYDYTGFPEQEVENPYFWFYITFNDLLAQYFQFALIAPEPFEADYYIKFKNENPINFLTTNQYNDYLVTPPTNDMTKEIEWFCFEVYFPDYMASFRPITAQIAYEFGFSSGESVGFDSGYNVGYNNGYNNGYSDGIRSTGGVHYIALQNYNQLISIDNVVIRNNLMVSFQSTNQFYIDTRNWTSGVCGFSFTNNFIQNHKYYVFMNVTTTTIQASVITLRLFESQQQIIYNFNERGKYDALISANSSSDTRIGANFTPQGMNEYAYFYLNCVDLTDMYGEGNEPTINECRDIFVMDYYPYSGGDIADINYYDGYSIGYNEGYEKGKDVQSTQQLTSTGWISSIFGGISSLLNIQIFPGVTIGIIVGIPFVISLAYFVIRAFRGGGGD